MDPRRWKKNFDGFFDDYFWIMTRSNEQSDFDGDPEQYPDPTN